MPNSDPICRRRWFWICAYLALALVVGISGIIQQPLNVHFELARFFTGMAATLFGILGIWVAVLDPKALLSRSITHDKTDEQALFQKLLSSWLNATTTFMLSLFLAAMLGFNLPQQHQTLPHWQMQLAAGANLFLLLMLLDSILFTLLPVANLRKKIKKNAMQQENR